MNLRKNLIRFAKTIEYEMFYRRKSYYFWRFITFLGMVFCFYEYFHLENDKWSNLFGNAFAGCLTGFIVLILGNIKNRGIEKCDDIIGRYERLKDLTEQEIEMVSLFLKMDEFNALDVAELYKKIDTFLFVASIIIDIHKKYDVKFIMSEIKYNDYDFTVLEDRKSYLEKIEKTKEILCEIKELIKVEMLRLEAEKNILEKEIL